MEIRLPYLAEGVSSATVVNLLVSVGDKVKRDDPLLEVETQKAVAPIPSAQSGTITKIHVEVGQEVTVGQLLVSLSEEAGETRQNQKVPVEKTAQESRSRPSKETVSEEKQDAGYRYESPAALLPPASPAIRKLARDLGIDLTRVRGTEPGGRIVLEDLRNYTAALQRIAAERKEEKPEKVAAGRIDFSKWGPIRKGRMSLLRQTVAERMRDSWSTIPHVTQFDEADVTWFSEQRKGETSLTCFVIQAALQALKKYPAFNSSLDESTGEIVYKDYYHFGIAVDTEAGLMAPVIRDVDKKGLRELAVELKALVERTRQRKVALEELEGASFTISNQGTIGGAHFTPIIHKPEVAILGLGRSLLKPVARDGGVQSRMLLPLCLSYDHRVVDGADAARFMMELVQSLEKFAGKIDEAAARKG